MLSSYSIWQRNLKVKVLKALLKYKIRKRATKYRKAKALAFNVNELKSKGFYGLVHGVEQSRRESVITRKLEGTANSFLVAKLLHKSIHAMKVVAYRRRIV